MVRELLVVIPVFNEEACLDGVLSQWTSLLDSTGIVYAMLVLDDGSTDGTPEILRCWAAQRGESRFRVVRHANRGHGQTCLEGYRIACDENVPWVLQIDSDGQCDPRYFAEIWRWRDGCGVVYGRRKRRQDGWRRILASGLVRVVVRVGGGVSCVDANVPYRLMRTAGLRAIVDSIPASFDLANIALAVQLKRAGWEEATVPIIFRPRAGGEPSVPLSHFAAKAFELTSQLWQLHRPPHTP